MELRRIFDTIPEKFDRWRPRYCEGVFSYLIEEKQLNAQKDILEIGPGTGQATEPFLKTGSNYLAVELGENLTGFTKEKFKSYNNFKIVNADFETYDFGVQKFDLILSAATIQWIPEETAFSRCFDLLKPGGTLAMMMLQGDYKTPNENLYNEIQKVYAKYFHPETPYTQKMNYNNVLQYGFINLQRKEFYSKREFNAKDYIEYIGTHCDHIVLKEPYQSELYKEIRKAIFNAGNKIVFKDKVILYLAQKPTGHHIG